MQCLSQTQAVINDLRRKWVERLFRRDIRKWFRSAGDQTLRLQYPLNADSVVFDIGGFRGDFAAEIYARYQCHVHVFEPVPAFCKIMAERFRDQPKIVVHEHGVGATSGKVRVAVNEDRSSHVLADRADNAEEVEIVAFSELASQMGVTGVDLMKINIEGAEYELLEHLIAQHWIEKIQNVQVQFHHFVLGATTRRNALRRKLRRTHRQTYNFYFVWENWSRRTTPLQFHLSQR